MASAEPLYHSGPVRICAGTGSTNWPSIEESRQPREMCVFKESDLYWVRTFMRRTSELAKLESTKSMIRYRPPKGTAGLARSWVRGASLLPSPPARIIARVLWAMPRTVDPRTRPCNGCSATSRASGGPGLRGRELAFRRAGRELADGVVDLFGHPADELGAVVEGEEGALESGDEDVLQVGGREIELARENHQLLGDGGVGDEPVVRIHRHADAEVKIELERVGGDVGHRARLHVRRRAALDRNAVIVDIVEQV